MSGNDNYVLRNYCSAFIYFSTFKIFRLIKKKELTVTLFLDLSKFSNVQKTPLPNTIEM